MCWQCLRFCECRDPPRAVTLRAPTAAGQDGFWPRLYAVAGICQGLVVTFGYSRHGWWNLLHVAQKLPAATPFAPIPFICPAAAVCTLHELWPVGLSLLPCGHGVPVKSADVDWRSHHPTFLTCSGSIRIAPHSSPCRLTSISGSFDAARSTIAPNATIWPASGPQMTSSRSPGV